MKAGGDQRGRKVAFKKQFHACLCKGVCVVLTRPVDDHHLFRLCFPGPATLRSEVQQGLVSTAVESWALNQ